MAKSPKPEKSQLLDDIPDIKRQAVVLPVQCGSCIFHSRMATYSKPCIQLGTPASAETCRRFVPDPTQIGPDPGPILQLLASAVKPVLLAAAMLAARKVSKLGFKLGERVFFRVMGADYVNNYVSGVIVGAVDRRFVLAGAEGFTALLESESVLNNEGWEHKLEKLLRAGKVDDPNGGLRRIASQGNKLVAYVPEPLRQSKKEKFPVYKKAKALPKVPKKAKRVIILSGGI